MELKKNSIVRDHSVGNNNRIAYLDLARIVVAFLVIYGHLYTPSPSNHVRIFIYQFHMPFFFLVSGMLHKFTGQVQLKKYVKSLLIPIVSYVILFYLITGVFYQYGFFGYKEAVPKVIVGQGLFCTYSSYLRLSLESIVKGSAMLNGPCWFLIALFYCKCFMDFVLRNKKIGVGLFFIGFCVTCCLFPRGLFIGNFFMAMPFYCLGYFLKDKITSLLRGGRKWVVLVVSICLMPVIMNYNGSVSMWAIKFGNLPFFASIPLFYINGLLGSFIVLSLCINLKISNKWILGTANSLISILGLQALFVFLVDNVLGYNLSYITSLFIVLWIMAACVICHRFIMFYVPWIIGKKK